MNTVLPDFFALLERSTGIALDLSKTYLVEARLAPLARREGASSVKALIRELNRQPPGALHREAFEALSTHETSFFRDPHCFAQIARVILPELIAKKSVDRSLRIWSAAASTGQEAYSVAMLLREALPDLDRWHIRIHATDFSQTALDKASAAHYQAHEVSRGLDEQRIARFLNRVADGYVIKPEVRALVRFERLNLIEPWPVMAPFDLILLRNVLIYFSPTTRARVLAHMHKSLHPVHGVLLLGSTEMIPAGQPFTITQLDRLSFYRPSQGNERP